MLLAKWKCIHESFPSEHARSTDFIRSGKAYTSFNLLRILIFFYENYWPRLTSSSKCRGSVSHGNIKFLFSGNASTGRHCLLLQFHLSIKSGTSFNCEHISSFALITADLEQPSFSLIHIKKAITFQKRSGTLYALRYVVVF